MIVSKISSDTNEGERRLALIASCRHGQHQFSSPDGVFVDIFQEAWEPRFSTMGRGATNGTVLSRGQIGHVEILIPLPGPVDQFEKLAAPISGQIVTLMEQMKNCVPHGIFYPCA